MNGLPDLDFAKGGGLLPAIVQDADSHAVLMLGYINSEALAHTLETGQVTFYSRSKQRLWTKGESSGNGLQLVSAHADCDRDTVLFRARPAGPTCHRGTVTCFSESGFTEGDFLTSLDRLLAERQRDLPEGSYSTRLFQAGLTKIAQKVGEEGVETALAAVVEDDDALLGEAADLVYHLQVLLRARGLSWRAVSQRLAERHAGR